MSEQAATTRWLNWAILIGLALVLAMTTLALAGVVAAAG